MLATQWMFVDASIDVLAGISSVEGFARRNMRAIKKVRMYRCMHINKLCSLFSRAYIAKVKGLFIIVMRAIKYI